MDKNLAKFLQDIAVTAANAADSARSAVETAGKAAMEKYDEVKTQRELNRERAAQEDIFAGLGRMLYAMHMGAAGEHVTTEDGEKTPQQVIDALLVKAEQAAFVRCDTEATRKAVCELLPSVDPRRIVLLRDALTLTPPDEDVSMPPSNVPEPLQLLAVGTMTSRKGYDTLLQACLALQKAGVDFRLTLVGTGPWRLRLRLLSWRLGLRKLVSFPGQLPHEAMTDLYRRTDIFIAPGHMTRGGDMDGLPSALTEAMAFGVAVVVSDLPGQLEVVQNGRSGIVVPQNDVTALSQALLDLAGSAEKRRHLGAEAWKRIREVLDEEATEARLTSLFKAACRR